ncbi:hypothetical protein MVEN_00115700 [Mycena venus]|uniref:DUF6699 domain-containing protein n=1 Tax=Mycena venus TaxID=2733690 RepID=A0A8H7DFK3_9AGAR|nr:hypothetical protein MVEN_00115700 [Mycena venus]
MRYEINAEHFAMPVHFVTQDYGLEDARVGVPAGMTSEGPSSSVAISSSGGTLRPFPCTPQFNFYVTQKHPGRYGTFFRLITETVIGLWKCRRLEEQDGIQIIRSETVKLIREIGSGPGYLLHAGQNNGRAVIVKVFNRGPTVRQHLESTVALSKEVMHPNVLRIEGISSPESPIQFIAYEDVHWKNAEGPLAVALKNDLQRSITLGFKMIAGLSAGMNYLWVHGVSLGPMRVENFDIFLDVDDRFVISVNPRSRQEGDTAESEEIEETAWTVFNAVCRKVLMAANRVLHDKEIHRDPAILDVVPPNVVSDHSAAVSPVISPEVPQNIEEGAIPIQAIPPRREYVWRTMDRGEQSLATVARRVALDLDTNLRSIHRLTQSDGQSPHRCPGYIREEITLATAMLDSAVVAHDTPSPLEICSVCHEVVAIHEVFHCKCGDLTPGPRATIKCRLCKVWSHSDCVGNWTEFICQLCVRPALKIDTVKRRHVHFSEDIVFPPTPSPTFSSTSLPSPYGPFTPSNAFNAYIPLNVGGQPITVHKVLGYSGPTPFLCFDVTLPPQNVKPTINIPASVLVEPATNPGLPSLVLIHPRLGRWQITARPQQGKVVLVRDVLSAIYMSLRQQATAADFEALPEAMQSEATTAFSRRWMQMPTDETKNVEKSKGLKRVDFLMSTVTFAGISQSQAGPNCFNLLMI